VVWFGAAIAAMAMIGEPVLAETLLKRGDYLVQGRPHQGQEAGRLIARFANAVALSGDDARR
jgi:hypothetical protein